MYTIRKAVSADFKVLLRLYRACGRALQEDGIMQWGDFYPTESQIHADIKAQSIYVLESNSNIVAVITLDSLAPANYAHVQWQFAEPALYVHRLAVHPQAQQQGWARKLMDFAESHAEANAYQSIRLDTYSINTRNIRFYTRRAYQKTREVVFLGQPWTEPFICFEKEL